MWNGCWKKPKNNAGAIMAAALFFERIEAMRHFYHLTHDDRIKIEALLKEKHTPKEIANNIGCHISTIYRELKRGRYEHRNSDWTTEERYSPDIADEKYRENLAAKGPGLKIGNDIELAEYIENKIVNEKYSPGAVLGEIKHKGITFSVAGCGSSSDSKSDKKDAKGKVYYLNFKPEQDEQWQDLAKEYTKETGVDVTVLTAASGEYEKTLKSEMAKSNAPTLFQVNGPVGLASWKDYCYDLKDSDVAKQLTSDDFALMDGDKMSGIAYVIESYGIIYNKELLKKAGYSADDITNFDSFKKVVEDITANKDKLGFSAFTSAGMDGSSDWRFKTHLANLPIYYEYKDEGIDNTDAIKGTYLDNYRQIWDLYINNATCKPTELSTKTADDATADFVTGDAVFYQNGTWEYNNIKDVGDDNLGILPIYIGVEGEEDQGICTGTENYWCVNSKASEDDIQATLDFMNWCVTSDDGVKAMCKDMGFTIPFKKNLKSDNVLVNEANKYTEDGKTPVSWNFSTMPSEEWKNGVGSALTSYAADPTDANWAKVTTAFVDGWAKEAAAAK